MQLAQQLYESGELGQPLQHRVLVVCSANTQCSGW